MKLTWDIAKPEVRVKLLSSYIKHVDDIGTIIAIEESEICSSKAIWVKFDNCAIGCSTTDQGNRLDACSGYFYPEVLETISSNETMSHKCTCDFGIVINLGCQCGGI